MIMQNTDKLTEILKNIEMSLQMEGMTLTPALRDMCLAVVNGNATLDDCLDEIAREYR